MKATPEIIAQEPIYLHNWTEKMDLIRDFENLWSGEGHDEKVEKYKDINILFASYGYDNCSGDAWVLFEKNGELFEVNGGHCSCYGLEGQWSPEPVVLQELQTRLESGQFGRDIYSDNEFADELKQFLGI